MSHHPQLLQAAAQQALVAREFKDPRWELLMLHFALRTQWTPGEVLAGIEALARGETPQ